MSARLFLGLAFLVCAAGWRGAGAQPAEGAGSTLQQLEQLARTNSYFSRAVLLGNQVLHVYNLDPNGPYNSRPLETEQIRLAMELRRLGEDRETMAGLLKSPDPKVRTLAMGALYQREDGRDLPLIATLINDPAPTFPDLHDALSSGGASSMSDYVTRQSVGDISQAMLKRYGISRSSNPHGERYSPRPDTEITADDLAAYWRNYAGRDYAASWFELQMKRAIGWSMSARPEHRPDIQRVLAKMERLPLPDRAWTELYVLAPEGRIQFGPEAPGMSGGKLLAMIRKLDPAALLRFLQGQPVSDDPDLRLTRENLHFYRMRNFILGHADVLLRPEDADALLVCGRAGRRAEGVAAEWIIGAALLQPARASELIHAAMAQDTEPYASSGLLAGALWHIRGAWETNFLVNWFYGNSPSATPPTPPTTEFLWAVAAVKRADTGQLLAALAKDPRFDHTDWEPLHELLQVANSIREPPLVSEQEIYDAMPGRQLDTRMIYPAWRNLLRHEYGLPERPLPSLPAEPRQILTRPAWSMTLAEPPQQMALSADEKWLAVLAGRSVTVWRADERTHAWLIPHAPAEGVYCMAFPPEGARLTVFHQDGQFASQFSEWDLVTRQLVEQKPLTGKPDGGLSMEGSFHFDQAARRVAFSGVNVLAGFDALDRKVTWLHKDTGSVRPPITLSADGRRLALGGLPVVKLYDATSGELLRQFEPHAGLATALALSPDGGRLAIASAAEGLQLWDTVTGALLTHYAYQIPGWGMPAPVFSPDGRWLAVTHGTSSMEDKRIGIFRTDSGQLEWEIRLNAEGAVGAGDPLPLAFSRDSRTLYTSLRRLDAWSLPNPQP